MLLSWRQETLRPQMTRGPQPFSHDVSGKCASSVRPLDRREVPAQSLVARACAPRAFPAVPEGVYTRALLKRAGPDDCVESAQWPSSQTPLGACIALLLNAPRLALASGNQNGLD